MRGNWESISFADLITERKDRFDPDAPEIVGLPKIEKIDFSEGKLHLGEYEPTKTQQIIVEPGDFVFSGLNIEKGAAGFNETADRLVVSANYSTCGFNDIRVSLDFFKHYMRSENFQKLLKANLKKDYGFTRPKHLMPLTFLVPSDKEEQERIVSEYEECKETHSKLSAEITNQQSLLAKLKQATLQEAIQGKLTADWRAAHPDVEPASQLLNRIQAEKARLIAAKKLRPEKPLPQITPAEIPFEIPNGWEWCRLGEICDYITKGTTPAPHELKQEGEIPFLKVYNIRGQKIDFGYQPQFVDRRIHEDVLSRSIVYPKDVLMNIVGPPLGKVAVVPNQYAEWNINQALAVFRPIEADIHQFLYLFLCEGGAIRATVTKGVVGQDNVSLAQCRALVFPSHPSPNKPRSWSGWRR